jgi:hypothetical protein
MTPAGDGSVEYGLVEWSGWPRELATWENLVQLRQAFSRAAAWGQAAPQAPGSVIASTDGPQDGDDGPRRVARVRRPNVRVNGSEWE